SGPVIEMAWARLDAVGIPDGPPLVVLPDGPGGSGLAEADQWLGSPLREGREIVLVDPRGTGRSFPSLDCGQPPRPGALPLDLVEDCRRSLLAQGVRLDAYDTAAIAADIADLAAALGLRRIDVLGVGHGAKAALTVLRNHPQVLHALVLDSPVPLEVDLYADRPANGQAALNRLLDECVQQPACRRAFGDLLPESETLIIELDDSPAQVEAGVQITGADLVLAALAAMRGANGPGLIPTAMADAVVGFPDVALRRLQDAAIAGAAVPTSQFSEGLRLSADCREEVPFSDADPDGGAEGLGSVGRAVAADVADLLAACAIWDVGQAEDYVNQPVEGDVPTLVLTGEFDPLSPPSWGAGIASRLEDAHVVQVGGAGHRVHDIDACTLDLVAGFLAAPARAVDGSCAADRSVQFVLP
ncbi:MAG TPA: alpha/beta fold hydrolase, partial [Euzebya sp.]|nr:alpha/beta fold hydrolase [Euzebya sp.]